MVGSIFYFKHKILKDEKTGEFDRPAAEKVLREEEEISRKTGNPTNRRLCLLTSSLRKAN
jgi:tetrahydromethanopterin S-methyltransferase subunit H